MLTIDQVAAMEGPDEKECVCQLCETLRMIKGGLISVAKQIDTDMPKDPEDPEGDRILAWTAIYMVAAAHLTAQGTGLRHLLEMMATAHGRTMNMNPLLMAGDEETTH
jgi:hypothetical protein